MTDEKDIFKVLTPFGELSVEFPEDGVCDIIGEQPATDYFRDVMDKCLNEKAVALCQANLQPRDLVEKCQPDWSALVVIPPMDYMLHEQNMDEYLQTQIEISALNADLAVLEEDKSIAAKIKQRRLNGLIEKAQARLAVTAPVEEAPAVENEVQPAEGVATLSEQGEVLDPEPQTEVSAIESLLEFPQLPAEPKQEDVEPTIEPVVIAEQPSEKKPSAEPLPTQEAMQRAELDAKLIAMGLEPSDEYLQATYGRGWRKREQAAQIQPPAIHPVMDGAASVGYADPTAVALAAVTGRMAAMIESQNKAIVEAIQAPPRPMELTLKQDSINVKVEQPASIVHVTMPEQQAPAVHVNVEQPQAPAVQITNEVHPASVSVDVTAKIPPRQTITMIERDLQGEIKRVDQREADMPTEL